MLTTAPNAGEVLKWTGGTTFGTDNTGTTTPLNDIGNDTTGVANGSVLKYNPTQVLGKLALTMQVPSLTDTDGLTEGPTNLLYKC